MVLLEGKSLLPFLIVLIANTSILAIPLEYQVFPNCPGCQTKDSSGICQKTNTVLKDGKCYYLDPTKQPFDAGPKAPRFPYPCTGCQKKDPTGICQYTLTVLGKDMKCYYRDLSMPPFHEDTEEDFGGASKICTGCQQKDIQGECQNTSTILKDGVCYYNVATVPPFDAVKKIPADKEPCDFCQRVDNNGRCQNTSTILNEGKCHYIDYSMPFFYALPNSKACPGCQRRDENGICQDVDTVLTSDGMCYYIDPGYGHYDSLPYPTVCPECQKFDFTGICVDTTAILKDGMCYYIDSEMSAFDAGEDTEITGLQQYLDSSDCPGCQLRDLKGICQPTATVLRDGKCYYSNRNMPHFNAGPPSPNPTTPNPTTPKPTSPKPPFDEGKITPEDTAVIGLQQYLDSFVCPGCQLRDLKGICQPTATVLRDGKCYYSNRNMPHFNAGPPSPN